VHVLRSLTALAVSIGLAGSLLPGAVIGAQSRSSADTNRVRLDPGVAAFYAARGGKPLWISHGRLRPEAQALVSVLASARRNGFDPVRYAADRIRSDAEAGSKGDAQALARAELQLSTAFALYAGDLRKTPNILYVESGLTPRSSSARSLLEGAASAPSLMDYLRQSLAMNPLYETVRSAYGRSAAALAPANRRRIEANLDRLRAIPANPGAKWIFVDSGGSRLWMMEGRSIAGSMRVIVGKPGMQTPLMAARLRYAILNPYWNLPPDLVRGRAQRVLRQGPGFLRTERLQLLSDWGPNPHVVAPGQVNWNAIAAGRQYLRMRQLPGGANVMGAVKFMMPNDLGIYLHDFPDKSLFARSDRHLSSGCVRLEDAPRLARWLFGGSPPRARAGAAEQIVPMPQAVPVYIVYLTAFPSSQGINLRHDVYGRDKPGREKGTGAVKLVAQDPADRRRR
jgi:murein L,D-transpeptidase YcbB/YkuD